jgi:hypothetical protein
MTRLALPCDRSMLSGPTARTLAVTPTFDLMRSLPRAALVPQYRKKFTEAGIALGDLTRRSQPRQL